MHKVSTSLDLKLKINNTRIISHKEHAIRNDFRGLVLFKENLRNDSPNFQKIKEHFT